jgi:hypothetical protein
VFRIHEVPYPDVTFRLPKDVDELASLHDPLAHTERVSTHVHQHDFVTLFPKAQGPRKQAAIEIHKDSPHRMGLPMYLLAKCTRSQTKKGIVTHHGTSLTIRSVRVGVDGSRSRYTHIS